MLVIQIDKSRKNNEATRTKQHDETTYQHTHTDTHTVQTSHYYKVEQLVFVLEVFIFY